ncbi:MAG: polysaccharide deacetylase family protein [Chloroflexota bacterium]
MIRLLLNGARVLQRSHARILAYHSVSVVCADPWTVSPQQLDSDLALLCQHGFTVCGLPELISLIEAGKDISRRVCLTFDDAFADFKSDALPILEKWQAPATVYVATGKVGGHSDWSHYAPQRPLMNLDDLVTLGKAQVEITVGSHSIRHERLSQLPMAQLEDEVTLSLQWLNAHLNITDFHFAYPYGDCTLRERQVVQTAGYRSAVLLGGLWGNSLGTDRWALVREPMLAAHTPADLAAILSGKRDWHELWVSLHRRLAIRAQKPINEFQEQR